MLEIGGVGVVGGDAVLRLSKVTLETEAASLHSNNWRYLKLWFGASAYDLRVVQDNVGDRCSYGCCVVAWKRNT